MTQMEVGIGLPNALDGVRGRELIEWAVTAERRGFSVLGSIGRFVFNTHDEIVAFAAAAAVTERIELMPTVMLAPPRQAALLAKQAATLDHIAEGRFRLGMGVGIRPDDYNVMGASFATRGAAMDELLDALEATWSGRPLPGADAPVGPPPYTDGGPTIVLGGGSGRALQRVGERAGAWIASLGTPDHIAADYKTICAAAERAGRPAPRFLASGYFALGHVDDEVSRNIDLYYRFGGTEFIDMVSSYVLRTADQITAYLRTLEDIGAEEVTLWPQARGLGQVDALADIVL
jgi:alkanesulfonate monooxygenase SsuD/methylene tetrahydromethanopterin reductase-like flavin-dependent oxidoreductase (luciferase family)